MKPIAEQSDRKAAFTPLERKPHPLGVVKKRGCGLRSHQSFLTGFTIIELMTVMSVIIILIGLLVPSLNALKSYARDVVQRNQFHAIEVALDFFNAEWDGYPPSTNGNLDYCGAMKLCEAMVGQDLLGFHPDSRFRKDGTTGPPSNTLLYYPDEDDPGYSDNLRARRMYLPVGTANAYKMGDLYYDTATKTGPFDEESFVLCDKYLNVEHNVSGKLVGMPILYYKADTSKTKQWPVLNRENIYNSLDNHSLVALGVPGEPGAVQPLSVSGPMTFFNMIVNKNITAADRPYRADSYILISAGYDGLYGTSDDILNFRR